jgi:hypothetical protein
LPGWVVLEHYPGRSCTFSETRSDDGKPGFMAARYFYWEEEVVADYHERLGT